MAVVYVSDGEGRSLYVIWCCPKGYWGGMPASVVVALRREVLCVPRTTRCNVVAAGPIVCTTVVDV
jgi:hypothetical protein